MSLFDCSVTELNTGQAIPTLPVLGEAQWRAEHTTAGAARRIDARYLPWPASCRLQVDRCGPAGFRRGQKSGTLRLGQMRDSRLRKSAHHLELSRSYSRLWLSARSSISHGSHGLRLWRLLWRGEATIQLGLQSIWEGAWDAAHFPLRGQIVTGLKQQIVMGLEAVSGPGIVVGS